jgi:PAS domain S-box-containing protein
LPTYIFDTESLAFVETNDALIKTYGYSRDEFINMTLKDIRFNSGLSDIVEDLKIVGDNDFHSTSMFHKKKDGTIFPVEINSHSLPEKNGRKTRIVMVTDITERLKATEQMNLAREKAEASDKLKTTFLNNISHEVRTPLNGILGFAEIMSQEGLSKEDLKESVSMLNESSNRLLETITNYMDISLLTSGSMTVTYRKIRPVQILRKLYADLIPVCSVRKLDLVLDIPVQNEYLSIISDSEIFEKIVLQILRNAIKFTKKGTITFGLNNNDSRIEIFVRDTGIGIGKESLTSIFDRFVKEDAGPDIISEGSGLGLSIAKGLTELLGGKISVESQAGKGSYFWFSLPTGVSEDISAIEKFPLLTTTKGKNPVILVAEDDETNFYYLNALLSRETSGKILHGWNGSEALEIFRNNPDISLVLMDIKMPVMDGIEATRQIKLLNSKIPVIAITAYAMSGDEEKVLSAGCDGYLSKPISKVSLMKKISPYIMV